MRIRDVGSKSSDPHILKSLDSRPNGPPERLIFGKIAGLAPEGRSLDTHAFAFCRALAGDSRGPTGNGGGGPAASGAGGAADPAHGDRLRPAARAPRPAAGRFAPGDALYRAVLRRPGRHLGHRSPDLRLLHA